MFKKKKIFIENHDRVSLKVTIAGKPKSIFIMDIVAFWHS